MKISKEAAALLRKLLVKPVLMPEWEINKKRDTIAELERRNSVETVGSSNTGRFVAMPSHLKCDEVRQLMVLDMVADKKGIVYADLMRWARDIEDIGVAGVRKIVKELVDLGVLVMIDSATGDEVCPKEDEHDVMAEVIEDDGTVIKFV